jgi:hypothetical protein
MSAEKSIDRPRAGPPALGRQPSPLAAPEKFAAPYPFAGVIRGVSSVAVYFPGVIRPGPASGSMSPLILSGLILSGLARRGEMILSEIASFLIYLSLAKGLRPRR